MQRFGQPADRAELARLAGLVLLVLCLSARPVCAANPAGCGVDRPWVSVEFTGRAWPRRAESEVMEDLQAGLRPEGIDVCTRAEGQKSAPLAAITLKMSDRERLSVTIELKDAVTEKRISRDVSLARIPEDGRPLATAIAADELLRASWAEVALDARDRPRAPAPPEVSAAVRRVLPERPAASLARAGSSGVGARAAVERYERQTTIGADIYLRPRLTPRWGAELALGLRDGLAETSEHGRIDATATAMGLGAWLSLVRFPAFEFSLEVSARASRVVFSGEPLASASGREAGGWALYGRGGAAPALRLIEPLWMMAAFGVGAPLTTFAASDDARVVTGFRGIEWFASLGMMAEL